jgi:predicted nucleotidyltransferase
MNDEKIVIFIKLVTEWVSNHGSFNGLLLVGSHAHGAPRPDSDIDLVLLTDDDSKWIEDHRWAEKFGKVKSTTSENWGVVRTVRVFFAQGSEVEFNFAPLSWSSVDPIDPGTFRVISDGAKILYDPNAALKQLIDAVKADHS